MDCVSFGIRFDWNANHNNRRPKANRYPFAGVNYREIFSRNWDTNLIKINTRNTRFGYSYFRHVPHAAMINPLRTVWRLSLPFYPISLVPTREPNLFFYFNYFRIREEERKWRPPPLLISSVEQTISNVVVVIACFFLSQTISRMAYPNLGDDGFHFVMKIASSVGALLF